MSNFTTDTCADCGLPITMGQGSYFRPDDATGRTGRTYHSTCGDPFGVKASVVAERERCAKIAEDWLIAFGAREPKVISPQTWANDAVRDIVDAIRNPLI